MTSWLNKQRKQALLDLSSEAGLQLEDDLRKDDIVEQLDAFLTANATRLSRNASFDPYFGPRKTPGRPSSTALATTDDDSTKQNAVKRTVRRTTTVKQEEVDPDYSPRNPASSPLDSARRALSTALSPSTQLTTTRRTPGRSRAHEPRLPASPADVADLAEYESTQFYARLNDLYTLSSIPEAIEYMRQRCSSVAGVQMFFITLESSALQWELIGWVHLTDFRYWPGRTRPLYYPDLFDLLKGEFWSPMLLWLAISLAIPSLLAYFFNLTLRDVNRHGVKVSVARYTVDPLVFNVVKGILTYVVLGTTFGSDVVGVHTTKMRDALVGGYAGPVTGSAVVILAALYEAAQRKSDSE
ncbi:hypothetical protein Tdes44962_MAKER04276 [Teratosphaeria destructans]|uniref:Uncharacterized protein n=1 Tax=Teratosphaeria destructans TaxID=418781 RepID=A0A9W7W012_9PEZI|nr:hypothetical protein Tdes44962_MAKER04276 [Teratosphaeria destructans]